MIQAVVLAPLGGLTVPNPYGDVPLLDGDPAKPNEAYFRHVDFVVNKAEELGLFIGMLPTWGSYWASGKSIFTPATAPAWLVPDQRIILNGPTTGGARIRAARASDGSFALVYSPRGESFTLDKSIIKAERQRQYWYDPRYGTSYAFKDQDSWGIQTFTPPTNGRGNDWILVLLDAAAVFPVTGGTQ